MNKKPVVVTTAKKGVFFGYLTDRTVGSDTVILTQCRMCIYWAVEVKGVLGLAVVGPLKGSRVTSAVANIEILEVTAVMDASPEATKQWEAGLWS